MKIKAYSKGILSVGNVDIECYVLDDKENTRVLSATAVFKAFGRPRKGINNRLKINGTKLPPFMASKSLEPLINQEIMKRTNLIEFYVGDVKKTGYNAELLPDLCALYLDARRHKVLTKSQLPIAEKAEMLLEAFAKIGIIALIDEATGFQHDRKKDALKLLLERYIEQALQKWVKTFPDAFFNELDRLYKNDKTVSRHRPMYYGKFINEYIYKPLENGYVKAGLDEKNILPDGKRKARFHQWLTSLGRTQLTLQLGRIIGVMELSSDINAFKRKQANQGQLSLFSDQDFDD